jgi:hypothetical protein
MGCITRKFRGYGFFAMMLQMPIVMVQRSKWVRGRTLLNNVLFWCSMVLGLSMVSWTPSSDGLWVLGGLTRCVDVCAVRPRIDERSSWRGASAVLEDMCAFVAVLDTAFRPACELVIVCLLDTLLLSVGPMLSVLVLLRNRNPPFLTYPSHITTYNRR